MENNLFDLLVIGGGAAGFFAAINYAERFPNARVLILEQSKRVLDKVKISGGGRCNVTHACFEPRELVTYYPRGNKALLGPFHKFMCGDMLAWLDERGVETKIEEDGRIFPISNKSQTIIDCFMSSIEALNISLNTQCKVQDFSQKDHHWEVQSTQGNFTTKKLLVATGSSKKMWGTLEKLGHKIVEPLPSLFTFNSKHPLLKDLPGLSVKMGTVTVKDTKLEEQGPILITHWGLSGPGILKLSAWGARILAEKNYDFTIFVNWTAYDYTEVVDVLQTNRTTLSRNKILNTPLFDIPKRLWAKMINICEVDQKNWADLSNKNLQDLANTIAKCRVDIKGKSTFKAEFVTCGGIELNEVNFKTMESKLFPNLYFAGEVLNIDGVTGGFNFQAAWTTAWLVSNH